MNTDKIIELTFYTLPALITAGVAYVFLKKFIQNDDSRRRFLLMRENQKQALPLRLQAYERMALFLERISKIGSVMFNSLITLCKKISKVPFIN